MNPTDAIRAVRETPPATRGHVLRWAKAFTGVSVATAKVCRCHAPPADWFTRLVLDPPPMALVLGPRGGGKSFLSALATHLDSRFRPGLATRILGGSRAQSMQIYEAIARAVVDGRGPGGSDAGSLAEVLKTECRYRNGSTVAILACSRTSVRGPHVPRLRLDEVDEIDPELREAAMGMAMARGGEPASVVMSSTWHRVGGPMAELLGRADAGDFPAWRFCAFEVLERCPESRSGRWVGGPDLYERCPACPLVSWCHSERDRNGDRALAKLADGHYAIDSLVQKVRSVSLRVFEADYLCRGPKADGVWFRALDEARVVTEAAEYDPALPVHLAIDSGVFTGAVAFQVRPGPPIGVSVFFDYLSEGEAAGDAARSILAALGGRGGAGRRDWTDPAGGARNPVGPTVMGLYRAAGLDVNPWPIGPVSDGLALVEALASPAAGPPGLAIHPRCRRLVEALKEYRRAKRGGQWQDYPEDPQHPHEDLVDALRGGLKAALPDGLSPPKPSVPAKNYRRVLY